MGDDNIPHTLRQELYRFGKTARERERVEVGDIYSNLHLHQDSDSGFYFDVLVVKGFIR